jgi:hypothetical protein
MTKTTANTEKILASITRMNLMLGLSLDTRRLNRFIENPKQFTNLRLTTGPLTNHLRTDLPNPPTHLPNPPTQRLSPRTNLLSGLSRVSIFRVNLVTTTHQHRPLIRTISPSKDIQPLTWTSRAGPTV